MPIFIIVAIAVTVLILLLWGSLCALKRRRLMEDLPTSKTTGVFIGFVELKGTAESEAPLTGFLSEKRCVHHSWEIKEHWSRTVQEIYRDSDGKTKTRTRIETGWTTVASGGESGPFYLKDDLGIVLINPKHAEIHPVSVLKRNCSRSDPLYFGKGPQTEIANTTGSREFTEKAIPLHQPLYIIGQARERDDCVAAEIAYDKTAPLFVISTSTEESLRHYGLWMFWLLGLFAVAIPTTAGIIAELNSAGIDRVLEISFGTSGGVLLVWMLGWSWLVYNSLIGLKNRVKMGAANIDVELKRRHDLIPRLVNIVEGLQKHERGIQETTALLRSQAAVLAVPEKHSKQPPLVTRGCASRLIALVENYPKLQANGAFMKLQENLIETEHRIALARNYYNDVIETYNNRRERFPESLIAAVARLHPLPMFVAENFEREIVEVHLVK